MSKVSVNHMVTLSTGFTLLRIVLVPFIVYAMMKDQWGIACALFVSAALTDLIDGFLARYLNQETLLGAYLDPIADKFLLVTTFATLACVETPLFTIPLWFVMMILFKEVVVVVGFLLLILIKGSFPRVQPTLLGKATTCVQILFVIWLFSCYFFQWLPIKTYSVVLMGVALLMVVTGIQYVLVGYSILINGVHEHKI